MRHAARVGNSALSLSTGLPSVYPLPASVHGSGRMMREQGDVGRSGGHCAHPARSEPLPPQPLGSARSSPTGLDTRRHSSAIGPLSLSLRRPARRQAKREGTIVHSAAPRPLRLPSNPLMWPLAVHHTPFPSSGKRGRRVGWRGLAPSGAHFLVASGLMSVDFVSAF